MKRLLDTISVMFDCFFFDFFVICNGKMKHTYRPKIDGLKAIVVSSVILYHAQVTILGRQPFKGRFIYVQNLQISFIY
jgi:hypothetical protein